MAYNHNEHYLPLLLRHVPTPCFAALDVGCGDGRLLSRLAEVSQDVVGIDPDPRSTARARASCGGRVTVIQDAFLQHAFVDRSFDLITAVASLHHMPFADALQKMADLLNPGGRICAVGLYRRSTPTDDVVAMAAAPVNAALGRIRRSPSMGAPAMDPTMSLSTIRSQSRTILPGSKVRRLLLWRYLLTWTKPS